MEHQRNLLHPQTSVEDADTKEGTKGKPQGFRRRTQEPSNIRPSSNASGKAENPGPPLDLDCDIFGTSDAETQREDEEGESRSPVNRPRTPPTQTDTRSLRGHGEGNEDEGVANHLYYGENQTGQAERKERR